MKNVVWQILLISILQKSELMHNVMVLMKSVVKENKNKYYYDIFLEKDSYKDKSNTWYF